MKKIVFWAIAALLFFATKIEAPTTMRPPLTGWERSVVKDGPAIAARWQKAVERALAQNRSRLPRDLVVSIMLTESMGKPHVRNPSGAAGLLGVKPVVCRELKERRCELFNPHKNLSVGIRYLRLLERKYGFKNEKLVLAYGVGPERAKEIIRTKQWIPAHTYVRKVLYARRLSKAYLADT